MTMAERIQTIRKSKGLSQEELANSLGVSRQAVSKWESGQSVPDLDKVVACLLYTSHNKEESVLPPPVGTVRL